MSPRALALLAMSAADFFRFSRSASTQLLPRFLDDVVYHSDHGTWKPRERS